MNCDYDVIILIIASDNFDYYIDMQKVWRMYMNKHPKIKPFFIKENPDISDNLLIENDTIHVKCNLSLIPGILIKTIESFKYIYNNYNFKYIFRTNLSSFIDLNKLYSWAMNNTFNYAAVIGECYGTLFGSGAGFFLTKESINYLININNIDYGKNYDDVVIGELLIPKFSISPVKRIDMLGHNNENINFNDVLNSDVFHFRCKDEGNMPNTVCNLLKLYELIYKE